LQTGQKTILYAMSERLKIPATPDGSGMQIGPNALVNGAGRGYGDVVQMLFDKGVDVNGLGFGGTTPILIAAAKANRDIVQFLMNAHADVNLADRHGDTALMAAVRSGSLSIVHSLLLGGAKANAVACFSPAATQACSAPLTIGTFASPGSIAAPASPSAARRVMGSSIKLLPGR
jgi:ankyrin repeat protein